MKKIGFVVLLLIAVLKANAQNLQGKVVDEVTGTGIPFVSVGIMGTNNATVSNENGDFVLKSITFPAKLRCSHVSFLTVDLELDGNQDKVTIKLKPASITLNTVVIDPYQGQRIIKHALEKAKEYSTKTFYANAFYRQLTTVNDKPTQIYELFYDLQWNTKRVQGWVAKESRFAEQTDGFSFSLNNQSYLTFSFSGYLLPEKAGKNEGKFVNLTNLPEYTITIEKYIEQADQKIAVLSCRFKNAKRNQFYTNSTYYVGVDDLNIYRLENNVYNLPMTITDATSKFPPVLTTIATFNGSGHEIPILESISTKLLLSLSVSGLQLSPSVSSLLTVFNTNNNLKDQKFQALNRTIKDKQVIESIAYNALFWKDNPIVKQTTLEDAFIKLMEGKSAFGTMVNP